jgi:hypothetical protein
MAITSSSRTIFAPDRKQPYRRDQKAPLPNVKKVMHKDERCGDEERKSGLLQELRFLINAKK